MAAVRTEKQTFSKLLKEVRRPVLPSVSQADSPNTPSNVATLNAHISAKNDQNAVAIAARGRRQCSLAGTGSKIKR
jgi:hypothetical protein